LEVEPGSQLAVVEEGRAQVFALNAGSLRADVAKLGSGERFIVRTADAEVEVRGTSFLVDVVPPDPACGAGNATRVQVFEGVGRVRAGGREAAVGPGEHWPRDCRQSPALAPSERAATEPPALRASVAPTTASAVRSSPAPSPPSAARVSGSEPPPIVAPA